MRADLGMYPAEFYYSNSRLHKCRTCNYVSTSAENGLAMAGLPDQPDRFRRLCYNSTSMFIILTLAHHMSPPSVWALSPGREHEAGPAGKKAISPDIPTTLNFIPRPSLRPRSGNETVFTIQVLVHIQPNVLMIVFLQKYPGCWEVPGGNSCPCHQCLQMNLCRGGGGGGAINW